MKLRESIHFYVLTICYLLLAHAIKACDLNHKVKSMQKVIYTKCTLILPLLFTLFFISGCFHNKEATKELRRYIRQETTDADLPKIRQLIEKGADINAVDDSGAGYTILHVAAGGGRVELTRFLLATGADPEFESKDFFGRTPFDTAFESYPIKSAEILYRPTPEERFATVKLMIDAGVKPETKHLTYAVHKEDRALIQLIFDQKVKLEYKTENTNDHYFTPLTAAAGTGNIEVMTVLLEHGVKVNNKASGESALMAAAKAGELEAFQFLLKHGASYSKTGNDNILHSAADGGNVELIKTALALGINIDTPNSLNETAIWRSVNANKLDATRFFLEAGADTSIIAESSYEDNDGSYRLNYFNARELAEKRGYREIIALFKNYDYNVGSNAAKQPQNEFISTEERLYKKYYQALANSNPECHNRPVGFSNAFNKPSSVSGGENGEHALIVKGTKVHFYSNCERSGYFHLLIISDQNNSVDEVLNMKVDLPYNGLSINGAPAEYDFMTLAHPGKLVWFHTHKSIVSIDEIALKRAEQVSELTVLD